MRIEVAPGSGTAVVGVGGAALVDATPDHPLVDVLFSMADSEAPDAARLAGLLASLGVETLPPFAIVLDHGPDRTLVARGSVTVTIGDGGSEGSVDATDVATWIERSVGSSPLLIEIAGNSRPSGALWLERGVMTADSLRITRSGPVAANTIEAVPNVAEPGSISPVAAGQEDDIGDGAVHDMASMDDSISEADAPEDVEPASDPSSVEAPTHDPAGDEPASFDFTHLVDHTVYRDSRDAEVRPDEEAANTDSDAAADGSDDGEGDELSPPSGEGLSITLPPESTEDHRGLISSVPTTAPMQPSDETGDRSGLTTGVDPVSGGRLGDHDGHTAVRAALTPRNVAPYASNKTDPRTVNGVLCPRGHANSPVADRCMLCREKLVDRSVRHVERPVLGQLRLPSGEVIAIDRPIVIGRKPVATELIGGEVPLPLTIDDDVVTRNHAQILIEEWHVLIVDLDSTNQTMITIPGQAPRVVAPNDPCVILPGTEIDLGGFGPVVFEGPR